MTEEWRDIEGYENIYQVSNFGNVRSLNRYSKSHGNSLQLIKGKLIVGNKSKKGYIQVGLWKNGFNRMEYVHRLVAKAFIPNPNGYPQVNHKDENKSNNSACNLEWCTGKYNMNYGSVGLKIGMANRNNEFWSKEIAQYDANGRLVRKYPSASEAQRLTGIDSSSIRKVCKLIPKHNTAGGYVWREIIKAN